MLQPALEAAGFRIEHSEVYLPVGHPDEDCHASVDFLARMGSWSRRETSTVPPRAGTYGLLSHRDR